MTPGESGDEHGDDDEGRSGTDPDRGGETADRDGEPGSVLDPIGSDTADSDAGAVAELATEVAGVDPSAGMRLWRDEHGHGEIGQYIRSQSRPSAAGGVAVGASLRAAAGRGNVTVGARDLRWKRRDGETPVLVVFAVDASASMRAHGHVATARRLTTSVLADGRRRDHVALVAFYDERAEVIVQPTDRTARAAARLDDIPTGNKTPLATGLLTALSLVDRERTAVPALRAVVVTMTDGRPTVGIGGDPAEAAERVAARLGAEDVDLLMLDLDRGTSGTEVCRRLAETAGGDHVRMRELAPAERRQVVARRIRRLRSRR